MQGFRYAAALGLRGALRQPRTTALAVVLLALGLAAVMSMLTLLEVLSATPLPGVSERLHQAWADSRRAPTAEESRQPVDGVPFLWKLGDAEAMMALQPDIRQAALTSTFLTLSDAEGTRNHRGNAVLAKGPMPAMFGVPLRQGRFWTAAEESARTPVVVLGEAVALELFGHEEPLGRDVRIGRGHFRVVGIVGEWAPTPRFHFLPPGQDAWGSRADAVFLPVGAALDAGVAPMGTRDCDSGGAGGVRFDTIDLDGCRWLALWAELPDAAAHARYRDALERFARDRHDAGVFERQPATRLDSVRDWLDASRVVPDSVRLNLWLAAGLLALCMVNVAGLLAARFLRRSGELGVRRVLGAPRRAVVVQCLVEAGVVGALGGLLALPLSTFGMWLVRLQEPGYADLARLEPRLFLPLCMLSVTVGLLVGFVPAMRAALIEPVLQVKQL